MSDLRDCEMVVFDEAIPTLVDLYRQSLEENPEKVVEEWQRLKKQKVELEFYDDDFVLLIPN